MSFPLSKLCEAYAGEFAAALPATARGSVDALVVELLRLGIVGAGWTGQLAAGVTPHSALDAWGPALDAVGASGDRQTSAAIFVRAQLTVLLGRAPVPDGGTGNAGAHSESA